MVTLVATYLNLGLRPDFVLQWAKSYIVAWPIAAAMAYLVTPMARRFTDRVVTLHRTAPPDAVRPRSLPAPSKPANSRRAQAVDLCADAIAERERRRRRLRHARPRRRAQGRAAARPQGHAAARPAGRAQGHLRHRRHADRIRLADLRRPSAEGRRRAGRADPPRRRHAARQDRHHRIRPSPIRARPAIRTTSRNAGRLVVGLGGRRRRRLLADRDRHARPAAR